MPYTKTNWVDRLVEFTNRFTKSNETATSVTLTADSGVVTQAGTPISAANLNKIEQGIADALRKDGSEDMTGNLGVLGVKGVSANGWGNISSGGDGLYLIGHNCYYDYVTNQYKYKNAHASLGARGIVFLWDSTGRLQPMYFDNGNVATTADAVFTPTLQKMWHAGNDGAGSGLDADLLDGLQAAAFALLSGATFTGAVGLPHFGGSGGFENGNGDAASYTSYNFALKGWWGLAMKTYDNSINGYYDFRTGKWDVKDGFYVNGTKIPPTRDNAGVLEFFTGGAWKPVGAPRSGRKISATATTSTKYQTALSVTGGGRLISITSRSPYANPSSKLKITIDGVIISEEIWGTNLNFVTPLGSSGAPTNFDMEFKTSLLIEIADQVTTTIAYEIM